MLKKRIIPSLLLKDGRMVKGKNFDNFRDVGNPVTAAKVYNAQKVDELIFLDICPSIESREKVYSIIKEVATECFMPLTVGGGIKNCDDIKLFLDIGADKIAINSSAVRNPDLIREASEMFGNQCIVVSIDYKKNNCGELEVFIDAGKTPTGISPLEHIIKCVNNGAGEILLTNIDNEGTMNGYDMEFIKYVSENIKVPVIASGGAGTLEHFHLVLSETNASAVSAGSIFHFTDQSPIKARFYLSNSGVNVRI